MLDVEVFDEIIEILTIMRMWAGWAVFFLIGYYVASKYHTKTALSKLVLQSMELQGEVAELKKKLEVQDGDS